ncbi:MAG TPA: fibronectin type III domain-containing protein [Gaiellaceae bacterium]|nr:fibronectin type III domain-containing protein [Gaiellaceae bacterium]
MLRRSAALVLLALAALAALGAVGAGASRVPVPDVQGVQTGAFSAVVKWRVPESARVVVEVGTDDRFGIWSPVAASRGTEPGKTTLGGLEPATSYRFRVVARYRNGMRGEARGSFRTDPWPGATAASATPSAAASTTTSGSGSPFVLPSPVPPKVSPGAGSGPSGIPPGTPRAEASAPLLVNGHPVFPRMVWRQCPNYFPTSIGAGINLFLGSACGATDEEQLSALAGRALATVDASTPGASGPGLIGWHLPDEADVSVGIPKNLPEPKAPGRVTFLTLTDKFSAHAAAGPYGKDIYPELYAKADVIGFDTYPVEVRCSLAQIENVYSMQRELIAQTGGKPTFQWIEAGPMEHCRENQDPTPEVVRAETWLAIAGGATGIGYFPDYWSEDIRNEVRRVNREIVALAPALLSPPARVAWSLESPVRIAARRYNGATYVIAVNTSTAPANASFSVPGLGGRGVRSFRDGRTLRPLGDLVLDKLPGLGVGLYVVPPPGW